MTKRLPRDVAVEIDQVAHFGHAQAVKEAVSEAAAAFQKGAFEEVLGHLDLPKRKAPRSVMVRELLGLAYYHLGRWREAARELAAYKRMSGRRDQDPPYADAERALGRPEKALQILEGIEEERLSEEVSVEARIVRAGALRELGRLDEAIEQLRAGQTRPQQVRPHHLRLWYALADALEDAGERAESRSWWDAIHAEDPDFFDVSRRRLGLKES